MGLTMNLPTEPVWRGKRELLEDPASPKWDISGRTVVTRTYSGPYAAMITGHPAFRQAMEDMPPGLLVSRVTIDHGPGDTGKMVVTLTNETTEGEGSGNPEPYQPKYEMEW